MKSSMGRPRLLSEAEIEIILAWHAEVQAWKAQRKRLKTRRQIAAELGVSESTIWNVLERLRQFKQAPPEGRPKALSERRRKIKALRSQGFL